MKQFKQYIINPYLRELKDLRVRSPATRTEIRREKIVDVGVWRQTSETLEPAIRL